MGIITKLSFNATGEWLRAAYGITPTGLIPTDNGISDTTYIVTTSDNRRLILKRFESIPHTIIKEEHTLLTSLHADGLNVPLPLEPVTPLPFEGKPACLYTALPGRHPLQPGMEEIKAAGTFLGSLHRKSCGETNSYPTLSEQSAELAAVVRTTPFARYAALLQKMKNEPDQGIIHGDLFPDNALFEEGSLGVIDWTEACGGPFGFDLGVVTFSWCFEGSQLCRKKMDALRHAYRTAFPDNPLAKESLLLFTSYAALFYGIRRYLRVADEKHPGVAECLARLEHLGA